MTFWGDAFLQTRPFKFFAGSKENLNHLLEDGPSEEKWSERDLMGATGSHTKASSKT
jgi:hypothetical protein